MKARQSASTVKSTGRVHRMGRNHKSCFVLNFLPSKIKQGIHAKPNSPMEKKVKSLIRPWVSGWHAPSSDENSGIRKWRVTAEKGQTPRVTPVSPSEEHRLHPCSQSEGKNECGAPDTLRSCNENMLKVWISHARYLSQTLQRHTSAGPLHTFSQT